MDFEEPDESAVARPGETQRPDVAVLAEVRMVLSYAAGHCLSDRERQIVERCVCGKSSLAEVGGEMDVTRERVRQLRDGALMRMKEYLRALGFKHSSDFL